MKALLDSHTLFWWLLDAPALSIVARTTIADDQNEILISIVNTYELLFKAGRGRLPVAQKTLAQAIATCGFPILPVSQRHAERAALFDWTHGDPWDRILAGQAIVEDCTLVSIDGAFDAIDIKRIW